MTLNLIETLKTSIYSSKHTIRAKIHVNFFIFSQKVNKRKSIAFKHFKLKQISVVCWSVPHSLTSLEYLFVYLYYYLFIYLLDSPTNEPLERLRAKAYGVGQPVSNSARSSTTDCTRESQIGQTGRSVLIAFSAQWRHDTQRQGRSLWSAAGGIPSPDPSPSLPAQIPPKRPWSETS